MKIMNLLEKSRRFLLLGYGRYSAADENWIDSTNDKVTLLSVRF
jgi:hypothetical protein